MSLPSEPQVYRQVFHDKNGIRLLLTCDHGSCLVEFTTQPDFSSAAVLDLLIQPQCRLGLPDGPAVELHTACVPLMRLPDGRGLLGRSWLPSGLSVESARNCFIRLRPVSFCPETTCV